MDRRDSNPEHPYALANPLCFLSLIFYVFEFVSSTEALLSFVRLWQIPWQSEEKYEKEDGIDRLLYVWLGGTAGCSFHCWSTGRNLLKKAENKNKEAS